MGYVSLPIQSLCTPRNSYVTIPSLLVRIYGHHDYNHPCHHGPYDDSSYSTSARHYLPSYIILVSYCSMIMPSRFLRFSQPTYFSYLSPTLPSLSLDIHSFNYSFLSRLYPFLLSLPHFLCNHSIFTYDVLSLELLSVMTTLVYIV